MRTEFKREMNRNYMVLHPETEMNETYSLRMLSENRITGLLPFRFISLLNSVLISPPAYP